MSNHAQRERLLLADLLDGVGPDASTLCAGWNTRDLLVHLVVRERRPDAIAGSVIGLLAGRLERVQAEYAAKPYAELVRLFREGPPKGSPFAISQVDEAANVVEFYVHGEDVRRAQPEWAGREVDPELTEVLWRRLERMGRVLVRKTPVGLVLRRPNGQVVVGRKGAPVVTVTGEPPELLLYAYGRKEHAHVQLDGPPEALERVRTAKLGM
ncbi:TIGR03085 family metal-binding protein [Allostreptomyces psammosilenae]|uniref:Uncharacterized protein (TIGR03085 family) n=1 Tax=Allostreptomyces psammosilenae TaxID=1892865 RepID=A0A853A9E7_9ACTN|nr:TIGR03085 family metal-binding protein [Allostreptomyces psammosilenae]NYI07138.1 uncharacterized protein (TIGR03085 family) [Allostreptomyces psammosilenae]